MLSNYIPICDAIVRLMDPLVEIVIHDIAGDSITYINGKLSNRKIGDASLLDPEGLCSIDQTVYPKVNFDGRLVKSVSVILEDKYLLCINCDISIFNKMQELSSALLEMGSPPQPLFTNDWQEKLHVSIHSYLQNHNLSFDHLSQNEKKALAKHLFDLGAFHEKNAADYVAKVLGLGRATVFKYLKEWRNQ
ncbi:MAG: PAS domain-containing protein [Alphaproteobacteria bacterium]|nr:PAS domain-containing protein [Alphaproteobacteria bacterium]